MITGGVWSDDWGPLPEGKPRYEDIVKYCKDKGHTVSLSAIGRYAKSLQTLPATKPIYVIPGRNQQPTPRAERIKDYMLYMIAEEAQNFCNVVFDLQGCLIHPDDYPQAEHAIPRIRKQAKEKLASISQAISDLESLGSLIPDGSIKRNSGQPRAYTEVDIGNMSDTLVTKP
jgi:hypothetical protein